MIQNAELQKHMQTSARPPSPDTFLLIPLVLLPWESNAVAVSIFSELFPTHSSTILPSAHLFQ